MVVTCPTWINLFSPWPYKKSKWLAKCPSIKKWTIWPMAAMPLQLLILPGRRAALVRHQGQRDFYSKTKVSYFAHTNTNDVTKRNIRCKCPLKKRNCWAFYSCFEVLNQLNSRLFEPQNARSIYQITHSLALRGTCKMSNLPRGDQILENVETSVVFQHVQSTRLCFKRSIFCRLIAVNSLVRNVTSTITSIGYEDLFLKQRRAFVGFFIFWGQKLNLDNRSFSMTPTNMVSWSQTHGLHITDLYLKIDGSSCLRPILINSYWFCTFHSKHLSHSSMYIWNKREKCIGWNISLGKKGST